jgi:hypothetical protein
MLLTVTLKCINIESEPNLDPTSRISTPSEDYEIPTEAGVTIGSRKGSKFRAE